MEARKHLLAVAICSASIGLTGCFGGSSSGSSGGNGGGDEPSGSASATTSGQFIDSAVEGLRYRTDSGLSGVTGEDGEFDYREGDVVTFQIGGVVIGQTEVSDIATPADLYPSADGFSEGAVRLARLLQSIDEDFDPETGIRIPEALREFLEQRDENFDFAMDNAWEDLANDAIDFLNQGEDPENGEGDGDSPARTLIDEAQATSHLERSIARYRPIESCDGVNAGDQEVEDIIAGNRFAQLTDNGGVTFTLFEMVAGAGEEAGFQKIESGPTQTVVDGNWSIDAGELKLGEASVGTPCNAVTALLLEDEQESARWSMMREFRASTATGTYAVDGGFLTLEDGESGKTVSLEEGLEISGVSAWQVNEQGIVELLDGDRVAAELHLLDDETVKTAVLVEDSTAEESEITAVHQARSAIPGRSAFAGNVLVHEDGEEVFVLWFDRTGPGEVTEISNDHNGGSSARVVDGTWDYSRSEGVLSLDLGPDEQHDIEVFEYADRLEFLIDDDTFVYHRTLALDDEAFSATYEMTVPTENDRDRDMVLFGNGQCTYLGTSPCDWDVSNSGRLEVSWSFNGEHGNVFAWALDDQAEEQRYVSVHIDRAFTDPEPGTMLRTGDAAEEPPFPEQTTFNEQVLTYEQDGEVFILWFDRNGDGSFTEVANDHNDGSDARVRDGQWSYDAVNGQLMLNFDDGEEVALTAKEVNNHLELSVGDSAFEYFAPRNFDQSDFAGEYQITVPTEDSESRSMTLFSNGQCDYLGTNPCSWQVTDDGQLEVNWTFGGETGRVFAWALADEGSDSQRYVALHIDDEFTDPEPGSMIRTGDAPAAPPEDEEDDEDDNGDVDEGPVAGEPLDREELIQATSVRGDFYQARSDRFENTVLVELTESRPGGVTITRFDGDTVTRYVNDDGQQETSSGSWDLWRDSQTGNTLLINGSEIDNQQIEDIRTDGHLVVGNEGFAASRVIPVEASLIEGQTFDLWMPEGVEDRQESLTINSDGSCEYFADTCSWQLEGGVLTLQWSHGGSNGDVVIWRLGNDPARYALVHNDFSQEDVEPGVMEAQMSEVTAADLIGQTLVDTRDGEGARVILEFSDGHYTEYSDDHFSTEGQSNKSFQSNWSFEDGALTLDGPVDEGDMVTFSTVTQNADQVRMESDGFTIYLDKTRAVNDEESWVGEYEVRIPSENDALRPFAIHAGNDCGYTLGAETFPCTWSVEDGQFVADFAGEDFHIRAERLRRDDGEHSFLHINNAPTDAAEGDVEVGTMHRIGLPTALEDRLLEREDVAGRVHGLLFGDPEDGELILRRYFDDGEFWDAANDHFDSNEDPFSKIMTGTWELSDGTLTTVFEDTDGTMTTENLLAFQQSDDEVIMVRIKDRDTFSLSKGADLDQQQLAGKTFDGFAPTDPEHSGRALSLGEESCTYEYGVDQMIDCDWMVGDGEFPNALFITDPDAAEGMTVIVHQLAANDTYVFIEIPAEDDEDRSEHVGVLTVNN